MIKKIIIISIFCFLVFSCGKKAEPEYNSNANNILINKV